MTFGITPAGFNIKRLEDIKAEIEAAYINAFGKFDTNENGPGGQLIAIDSILLTDIWELIQELYNARRPSTASGASLDDLAEVVGITRIKATKSSIIAAAYGAEGTILPIARVVGVVDSSILFESTSTTTITKSVCMDANISVANVLNSTLYTITIDSTPYTYTSDSDATALEIIAGLKTSIDAGSLPITVTDNLDGTANIRVDSNSSTFSISVDANLTVDSFASPLFLEATGTGPTLALAGTLTEIKTPVSGWDSVDNLVDATLGRDTETDEELRVRRNQSLQVAGSATIEAIRAKLLQVTGVTAALVIDNKTDTTDIDGRPPHSIESIVSGGTDADIAQSLWENWPGGIQPYGTVSEVVVDSQGINQTMKFSRATEIWCHLRITKTLNAEETYPADGDTQIVSYIMELASTYTIGQDVITQKFEAQAFKVPGLETVLVEIATSATEMGAPGAYSSNKLVINNTEVADFDSTRVTFV